MIARMKIPIALIAVAAFVVACAARDPYAPPPDNPGASPPALTELAEAERVIAVKEETINKLNTSIANLQQELQASNLRRQEEIDAVRMEYEAASEADKEAVYERLMALAAAHAQAADNETTAFTRARDAAMSEINAARASIQDVRSKADNLKAGDPSAPGNDASEDPTVHALLTLGGLLPPPFGAMAAPLILWGYREWKNNKNDSAFKALVQALARAKAKDPNFAEAMDNNSEILRAEMSPKDRQVIDKVRTQVGDKPVPGQNATVAQVNAIVKSIMENMQTGGAATSKSAA